ncbi:ribonuclease H [Senna tora]|uniref:Ribonuclease H n=1 Tax=Senna tora TaxID=362788 RepID=A0A834T1I9_9FABA|nr:ribonuclease H [Senna tora]
MGAELMAIKHGLVLDLQRGFGELVVEVDCLEAISLIKDEDISRHQLGSLIQDIRVISNSFARIRFKHVYREANQCANGLVKLDSQNSLPFTVWEAPPSAISFALSSVEIVEEKDGAGAAVNPVGGKAEADPGEEEDGDRSRRRSG